MHAEVDLIFDEHALERMHGRHVTQAMVRRVLGDYDEEIVRDDGRTEYVGDVMEWNLRIVLLGEEEPYVVMTVIVKAKRRRR